ncbi:MAG: hypothetical protein FJ291_09780 [Planctomycetes bacterium]|nr:hypothetical protein [Planctomycetota bacterium]
MTRFAWRCLPALAAGLAAASAAERNAVRVLYDFEDLADLKELQGAATNMALDVVQDNGVTGGKNCCRVVGKQGADYCTFEIRSDKIKGWADFDYFAMDVYSEREEKVRIVLELWDAASTNYATRCTFEDNTAHVGRNTMLWKINRAKRNNKEGREWDELEPKDKIAMNGLKMVKIFFTPFKEGGNTTLWVDRLRLMQEDAVGGKIKVALPPGAKAFDFGPAGLATPGFTHVPAKAAWNKEAGCGLAGDGLQEVGSAWPDPLTGGAIVGSGLVTFNVALPDGEYCVWLSAGKSLDPATRTQPFLLQVGDKVLCSEQLGDEEFFGEKGVFRHLRTQYSERPNALWLDYVEPACPGVTLKAKSSEGRLCVRISNHRLAALVVMPAAEEAAFTKLADELRQKRIELFYGQLYFDPQKKPAKQPGDGAYALWAPGFLKTIRPWSGPSEEERKTSSLDLKATIGQRLVVRVAVTPFEDLGTGDIALSDLKGPGTIPASACRLYYQNYRVAGSGVGEMALLPWTRIRFEPGITWAYWLWLKVPDDAKPGDYQGTLTFTPEKGGAKVLPVKLTVYPFRLEDTLPVSYGMYYGLWDFPQGVDRRKMAKEQFAFMREIGFTACYAGSGNVTGLVGANKVSVAFDPMLWEVAKEVGMGRHEDQRMMGNTLGMARSIARKLGLSPAVDQNPGIEFTKPELKGYYQDAIRQYEAFAKKMGLPLAVEVVDEPREMPNPWNRNLEQTCRYADWIHEASGLKTFVTPMGDTQSGKDYTPLAEHVDIVSVHAFEGSKRMIAATRKLGKTLWFYNTGMDRFSWGYYNWRMASKGRWEWHWSWGGGGVEGYPCPDEWYTPFTGNDGAALRAPYWKFPGGFLFKSDYLNVAQGINDYAYLITLEKALAKGGDAAAAADARKFLDALRAAIPELPHIKGLASPEAGALVGAGIEAPAAALCEPWSARIGEFIARLR